MTKEEEAEWEEAWRDKRQEKQAEAIQALQSMRESLTETKKKEQ